MGILQIEKQNQAETQSAMTIPESFATTDAPVQGTGADWLKFAIVEIHNAIQSRNLDAAIVAIIHDEVVVECSEEQAEIIKTITEESLVKAGEKFIKKVPVTVSCGIYNHWKH